MPGDDNADEDVFTAQLSLSGGKSLTGGPGKDFLRGGSGPDVLDGKDGADNLFGKDGDDALKGGNGSDLLSGGRGKDAMNGERGDDTLISGFGADLLHGGFGHDRLFGGDGRDSLNGGSGNDRLYGEAGNDLLQEDNGDGFLHGGEGNDWLIGGLGQDRMRGGSGDDIFIFRGIVTNDQESPVGKADIIEDFDSAGGDLIVIFTATPFVTVLPEGEAFRGRGGDPTGDTDVEVRWERVGKNALLQVDFGLDQKADMEITLLGVQSLNAGDFAWEI